MVLPAALWGEKTGTFTNIDRTVHVSHRAVEPPGEARSDLDIFLDFARRMEFKDRDGKPLVKWEDAAGAFEAWCRHSKGWFCDYSGLTYEKPSAGTGVQWPCNARRPDGTERIYTDLMFKTAADECETFGHDLETGTPVSPEHYKANDPRGRAVLKAADYRPPPEEPDREYPFFLTTGRVVYHFHTRTKTGRCPDLNAAAPEPFVEMCEADAGRLRVAEGDAVEVSSRRGTLRLPVRVGDILEGHLFVPFHYGYWDADGRGHHRAANELTLTGWDPVSKQPYFMYAAVRVRKARGSLAALGKRVADAAAKAADRGQELADQVLSAAHTPRSRVPDYLGLVRSGCGELAAAFHDLTGVHSDEAELVAGFESMAELIDGAAAGLGPAAGEYGEHPTDEPASLRKPPPGSWPPSA